MSELDLEAYLARIGYDGPLDPSIDTLRGLHLAHGLSIPFENLDILLGRRIRLDVVSIQTKLVEQRRGGYCFEHNTLFAAALREQGFEPVALLGRVRRGPPERWARTHMVLKVPAEGGVWLADTGFGAIGLVEPIPLADGAVSVQRGFTYTLRRAEHVWVLWMEDAIGQVSDLYEFSEDPQTAGDVAVANHYTSTYPESVFRRTITIQRIAGDDRLILRNETLTRYRSGRPADEPIDRARLRQVARDLFDVEVPEGPLVYESYLVQA